ncbi:unnamed protein product [Closterium sp. NIES-53]
MYMGGGGSWHRTQWEGQRSSGRHYSGRGGVARYYSVVHRLSCVVLAKIRALSRRQVTTNNKTSNSVTTSPLRANRGRRGSVGWRSSAERRGLVGSAARLGGAARKLAARDGDDDDDDGDDDDDVDGEDDDDDDKDDDDTDRDDKSASEGLCVGAAATTSLAPAFVAGSGATSQTAQISFTLDSGVSSCFFRDCTDLTPLRTPVTDLG